MTVEEKLKMIIIAKYGSMREFSKQIDMSQSTLATIITRGVRNASVTSIIKICQTLGISTDELAEGRIIPLDKSSQEKQSLTDVEDMIAYAKMNILAYDHLTLNGMPLTDEDKQSLLDALELSVEFIERQQKRRQWQKSDDR